jgi:hypothetical protein
MSAQSDQLLALPQSDLKRLPIYSLTELRLVLDPSRSSVDTSSRSGCRSSRKDGGYCSCFIVGTNAGGFLLCHSRAKSGTLAAVLSHLELHPPPLETGQSSTINILAGQMCVYLDPQQSQRCV